VVGHGFEEDGMDTNFVTLALAEWNLKNGTALRYDQLTREQQSEILQAAQELKQNANGRAE
jgi:hypothetical protein